MAKTPTANPAAGGAAAPADNTAAALPASLVQTSARKLSDPTPPRPRDKHTGLGGRYVRDPVTGQRTRVADPEPDDTAASVPAVDAATATPNPGA